MSLRITDVMVRTAPFSAGTWLDESRISTPMSPYPAFAERRSSWRGPGSDLVWLYLGTDDPEVFGIGQTRGGTAVEAVVDHLVTLLPRTGTGPAAAAEQLRRAAEPYAAGGAAAMAVSAVELALWDLQARSLGAPLHRLLGGRSGPLPYYVTAPHPDTIAEVDADLLAGARYVKVPMAYGPADGPAHLRDNLDRLAEVRRLVPGHIPLAVDCFMSWDVPYVLRFTAEAAGLGLAWVEEPLARDDLAGHAELRARLGPVGVAAGEHAFGLTEGLALLEGRCVDVLQSDVTWCGGLGVARTLGEVAARRGVTFAPHNAAMHPWALHLLSALGPNVLAEVLVGAGAPAVVPTVTDVPGAGTDKRAAGFG